MLESIEQKAAFAAKLESAAATAAAKTAFIGFDGFLDEIIHIVDKRDNAETFRRISTIGQFAERIAAAAGKSTNVELVQSKVKLGGNGPILANALAALGVRVTYLGALGYPRMHPVFESFASHATVHSIAEFGQTDALEFDDGKVLLTRTEHLRDVNWPNIEARFGREKFAGLLRDSSLVGFVNWTMLPHMSDIWQVIQSQLLPQKAAVRRMMFVDLADPEKRQPNDLSHALDLIVRFQEWFDVCLGLNEKEAWELGAVLGCHPKPRTREGLEALARELNSRLPISAVAIHPVKYALACAKNAMASITGPFVARPLITTGAGDHFNAGFCLGRLLEFELQECLLAGVAASGFYVRTARSPSLADLASLLRQWPQE